MAGEPATLLRLFRALWAALGRLLSTIGMPYTGIGIVGMVVGILLSPNEAPKEFYSAVAGVVPVLLLTLAVQARFFELPTAAQFRALWSPRSQLRRKPPSSTRSGFSRTATPVSASSDDSLLA